MEGADVYQIAKNCRTSVEMIQKFYAKHIMSAIDTAAINVVRPKPTKNATRRKPDEETLTRLPFTPVREERPVQPSSAIP